ncbi:MAG: HNH endonuclease [Candidatus Polarisedimenticolia bacterium]
MKRAYEAGELSWEATRIVLQIFNRTGAGRPAQKAWIHRGRTATIKRLREELRALQRERALSGDPRKAEAPEPMSDKVWHASRRREPGSTLGVIEQLERVLLGRTEAGVLDQTTLRLNLPAGLAEDFLTCVECHREAGLFEMLKHFVSTWDVIDPTRRRNRHREEILARAGDQCEAPGCTSRRNLHVHHVTFRSRGGTEWPTNKVVLCQFHHLRGIHEGLASCRGEAPLGMTWQLGREGAAECFANELRVPADR